MHYVESTQGSKAASTLNQPTARRFRVLLIDDDSIVTHFLEASLKKAGWCPIVARNGPEALDCADRENPDIVILDLMMPGMNGFEVCHLLRERSEVPIIVLSVRDDEMTHQTRSEHSNLVPTII